MTNSYGSRGTLTVGTKSYDIYRLEALDKAGTKTAHLPFSLRILLENLLRTEDGRVVRADDIAGLAKWDPKAEPSREIAFTPSRVLLQDFHGVLARRGPCCDARRDGQVRGRPVAHQPAAARRARHRPLGSSRRVRHAIGDPQKRRARVSP
jgi:hypothetical protein